MRGSDRSAGSLVVLATLSNMQGERPGMDHRGKWGSLTALMIYRLERIPAARVVYERPPCGRSS